MRLLHPARPHWHVSHSDWLFLVHSHLRWDFVWQRPQQVFSRLAESARVVFVEEAVYADDIASPRLDIASPCRRVHRVVPVLPAALRSCYDDGTAATRTLLRKALSPAGPLARRGATLIQWYYTPMPAPGMLGEFDETVVVYDCMDELAAFRYAPPDISLRERLLLMRADLVFTGGRRLYEAKSRLHPNVHFFGCGVDVAHFARARSGDTPIPADVAAIPEPVLGYFGVIDERLDYALLSRLADTHPDWSLVMIGPTAKVDPTELPQAPNIHWLGQRSYMELPAYVKAFDICLMPFALNAATQFINPTKTLEYMAAGKPIVSTPVPDVVRNFAPIVRIAASGEEFAAACAAVLAGDGADSIGAGIERAAQSTWVSIVAGMREHIAQAIAVKGLASDARGRGADRSVLAAAESDDDLRRDLA
jgi:glycosyltransferase involved in cell wall biosynthesis